MLKLILLNKNKFMSDADMKLTMEMTKAIYFDFIRNLLTSIYQAI